MRLMEYLLRNCYAAPDLSIGRWQQALVVRERRTASAGKALHGGY